MLVILACRRDRTNELGDDIGFVQRMISDRKDSDGMRLLPGLRYELFSERGLYPHGSVLSIWTGTDFVDDMTGEAIDAAGYSSAMLVPPAVTSV